MVRKGVKEGRKAGRKGSDFKQRKEGRMLRKKGY